MSSSFANHERILSSAEIRKIIPYSASHIWRMEKQGRFPRRVKLGPNRVGWLETEISNWIKARADARPAQVNVPQDSAADMANGGEA